jgi:outer membrane receptor protein involved in Fe transport
MSTSTSIRRAVHYALLTSAAAVVLPAQAQEDPAITEVIVTGSRIPQPNLTSISPVTAVTAEQIKIEGVVRVEDLINNLPQAFADFGGNLSNGATGAATVNLRNLGSERTLVLINGRRLMPGDPTQNGAASPDLNQIPGALIERVEVLTGGASAVYGADAVAGVVNFIMNDNFEGIRVDAQYGFYQHKNDSRIGDIVEARGFDTPSSNVRDGDSKDITFIAGINTPDGRGNATVYLGYRELDAFKQDQRDFSSCALGSGYEGDDFACVGSSTTAPARFGGNIIGANGELRPYSSATDAFNFAPDNFYQRPDERKTAGLFAHYDFSESASVYTEFMFMDDRTTAQIAASGAFAGSGPGQPPFFGNQLFNCDNPLFAQSMVDTWCGGSRAPQDVFVPLARRNVEGGGRIDDLRHTSFRGVVGLRGDFASAWNYDVYALYGESLLSENYQNDFSRARLGRALNAVADPITGQTVCRVNADADLSNDDPACVPYNIFQLGGVTPEQLAYLQIPGLTSGATIEQIVSGSIAGDLGQYGIKLPTANDGLGVAFGAEYRSESSELKADQAYQSNDLAGQGAPTLNTDGSFNVREIFAEARLPILQDKAFAKVLSAEAGYRYSDYNLGFDTDSYKLGLDWAPVDSIRFRGSYQRAVRSPNIQELFLQPRVQLNGNTDPCAGSLADLERTLDECALSGVTPAQYGNILENSSSQYNGLVGGNPDLDPEVSDTYSYGLVFTPEFLPEFSMTLDYFDIKVEKLIDQIGQDFILNQCLDTGDAAFCDRVNRIQAPGTEGDGSLWLGDGGFIEDPILNTGSLQTKGIDTEINYRVDAGRAGSVGLSLIGTYTDEFITEPLPGSSTYDCAGSFGTVCGTPIPEWRQKVRANWQSPWGVDVALTWRYIQEVDLDLTSSDDDLSGDAATTDSKLGSRSYFDLTASYTFQEMGPVSGLTGRLGINNLTDKDPPLVGQDNCPSVLCNGNTFPQVYDTLGRFVFLGLTADF